MSNKLNRVKEKLIDTLELPSDIILGIPKITLIGQRELTIENHKGILKFENDELIINTSLGYLTVLGNNFEIVFVGGTTITLRGNFESVGYEGNE